jgi:broad specificity phosphatase PhoE
MNKIFLLRHADYENPYNILPCRLPFPLSESGIAALAKWREYFSCVKIERIYTSPVLRCVQTSEYISQNQINIVKDVRLAEVLSAAQGSILEKQWREELYGKVNELGGETQEEVQRRVADLWNSIVFGQDKNYMICSHGDPLLFLYQYLLDIPINQDLSINHPEGYLQKAGVAVIEKNGEEYSCTMI